jgi:hypothetical protein
MTPSYCSVSALQIATNEFPKCVERSAKVSCSCVQWRSYRNLLWHDKKMHYILICKNLDHCTVYRFSHDTKGFIINFNLNLYKTHFYFWENEPWPSHSVQIRSFMIQSCLLFLKIFHKIGFYFCENALWPSFNI